MLYQCVHWPLLGLSSPLPPGMRPQAMPTVPLPPFFAFCHNFIAKTLNIYIRYQFW